MRAVVYTRQSLDRTGEGAAVARQLEDCLQLAALRGWEVVAQFSDNDTSAAGKKKRPGFESVLEAIESDRVTVVVAWALDRLSRNRRDELRLIELCEAKAATIALVRGSDLDMSTPGGILVADVMGATARHEIKQKGDRQRRAQQQAAHLGKPAGGRRAFGYSSDGQTVIPDEAKLVTEAYGDLLVGASLKSIARTWNERGFTTTAGNPWRHDNVRGVLKNARYAGLRTYRGEVVGPATWEAVIDRETFEAANALLSMPERRTTSTTARKYLLPGLAYCGVCGEETADGYIPASDVATGHSRHGQRVYVCRAKKCISRKAEPVDELIEAVMIERLSRPDAVELLSEPTSPEIDRARTQAQAIRERIDNLAIGLEEGILTLAAVRRSSERLKKELSVIDAKIQNASHADVLAPLVTSDDVAAAWGGCDLKQKRQAIDALMSITLLPPERGHQPFDPDSVLIEWKAGA